MFRPLWIGWRWWRRFFQVIALGLFIWLFRHTEYAGSDTLSGWESLFFRMDPLAGASAMLAARQIVSLFWPALVVLLLTLVLGRFFCGWICPLGTLLDGFHRLVRPLARRANRVTALRPLRAAMPKIRATRHVLLIGVLVAAAFAYPLVGLVDPFALLVRGLALWGDPALFRGSDAALRSDAGQWLSRLVSRGPGGVPLGLEGSIDPWVHKHLLPFKAMIFKLATISAIILAAIFALELVARRFWCRYLCPLGAGLGLLSRFSIVKRLPIKVCKTCGQCAGTCRMEALDAEKGFSPDICNLCMDCVDSCPRGIAQFGARRRGKVQPAPVDFSRRGVLISVAAGAALPALAMAARVTRKSPSSATVDPFLLRPPGAADEGTFLGLCVRCGKCMKVCPTNVLQPVGLQAGVAGLFSPHLLPRFLFEQSYCEYSCTLCGQVCPSGAIPRLTEEAKHARPTGKAWFDHNLCLPWAKETPCIRCEEMCPTPEKAIQIKHTFTVKAPDGTEVEIQQPYVNRDLCVGCGICESNCTIEGQAGIRVRRVDAPEPGTEFLKDGAGAATRRSN